MSEPAPSVSPPIYVTQPDMPPLADFVPLLQEIWNNKILTNGGPLHQRLEQALAEHLGVPHLSLFTNGTIALLTALQALGITGEVITTPYSFVATAHSLLWNGLKPVFVDIDPDSLNLDPTRIAAAITPQTTAIMPVHCYGRPCATAQIKQIADTHGLKVIYDAAHAFGVRDAGGSILRHGDLSVLSFHATKVFNTFEGGAIVSPDAQTKRRIDQLKNFGFVDEVTVVQPGINGKMNEMQAAFGLLQIPRIQGLIEQRQLIDAHYRQAMAGVRGIRCHTLPADATANYSYFPILVEPEYGCSRDALYQKLKDQGIHARRYFYPLTSDFPMYQGLPSSSRDNLPQAQRAARQVICLPIYPQLEMRCVDAVVDIIRKYSGKDEHGK